MTKCRFCNADAYGRFKLESFDGHKIEYDLCVEDALLIQTQGYDVKLIEKLKDGEKKE
jgi:hypothetical protein